MVLGGLEAEGSSMKLILGYLRETMANLEPRSL